VSVRTSVTNACGDPHRGHGTYDRGAGRGNNIQRKSNECVQTALSQTEHVESILNMRLMDVVAVHTQASGAKSHAFSVRDLLWTQRLAVMLLHALDPPDATRVQ
jgi:hypothetical protein